MLKKSVLIPTFTFLLGLGLAYGFMTGSVNQVTVNDVKKPLYWVAPMDANYRRDAPGKSPMGMDLVPVYETENSAEPAGTVSISSQIENQLGVKTAQVVFEPLNQVLDVAGFLQYDDTSVQHYHSRTNGWVEKLYIYSVGDKINQGQKLYDLYSPELVYGQEEYISALSTGNQHLLQSSRLKLHALGVSSAQITQLEKSKQVKQRLTFYAKKSGYVSHLNVREGMYIQPQIEMLATADLSKIWVLAEVFESQSAWLDVGLPVSMTLKAFSGTTWQGKVDYIFPNVNATNRTQQVRVVFDNADLALKPNMFAQLKIQAKPLTAKLLVPSDAVIVTGSGERVVLALGDGQYRSVAVTSGKQAQGYTQILTGLEKGQQVVTSAQFLIDSESNVSTELTRIDTPESDNESIDRVWILGTIKAVENGALKLAHEPVEKWQWPAMVMSLPVDSGIDISTLSVGDNIGFCLDEFENKRYVITHIEVEKQTKPSMASDHRSMSDEKMDHSKMDHSNHKNGAKP
ncbi:MAG: Cu(I)/Ag(I) efflux system membrane fusion protein [Oceanicoccus sp.]|jgi:Cu(I)/Ag(I) efflux system membrane fusion protein